MGFVDLITERDVIDTETFVKYARQTLGMPHSNKTDFMTLNKKLAEYFKAYPNATWHNLARTVQWAKAHKKRPARASYIVDWVRFAWADGFITTIDPTPANTSLEDQMIGALAEETDPTWRMRLLLCEDTRRDQVLALWRHERQAALS